MGEITLKIREGRGVVQVGLHAPTTQEEKRSLALYRRLKPVIEMINAHVRGVSKKRKEQNLP